MGCNCNQKINPTITNVVEETRRIMKKELEMCECGFIKKACAKCCDDVSDSLNSLVSINKCRCGNSASTTMSEGVFSHVIGCESEICGEMLSAPNYDSENSIIERWNTLQSLPKDRNEHGNFIHC
jgi:hypothetical protein